MGPNIPAAPSGHRGRRLRYPRMPSVPPSLRPPANVVPVARPLTLHTRSNGDDDGKDRIADEVTGLALGWNGVGGFMSLVFDRLSPQAPRWIAQESVERLFEH